MELYSVGVVLDCLHPAEENTFYKGVFLQRIREMTDAEFQVFCTEVQQLEDYYFYTKDRWYTDRPDCFENIDEDFYRIVYPLANAEYAVGEWGLMAVARVDGVWSNEQFISELKVAGNDQVYMLLATILKLEEHRAFAVNVLYTDEPLALINTCSASLDELITHFSEIDREAPLHFRIRRKK